MAIRAGSGKPDPSEPAYWVRFLQMVRIALAGDFCGRLSAIILRANASVFVIESAVQSQKEYWMARELCYQRRPCGTLRFSPRTIQNLTPNAPDQKRVEIICIEPSRSARLLHLDVMRIFLMTQPLADRTQL